MAVDTSMVVFEYLLTILVSSKLNGERIWRNMMKYHQLNDYLI